VSWRRVTSEELETHRGIVVRVDGVDGSVNIQTDGGTWELRPEMNSALTVRLDGRPPVMAILPTSGNSAVLKPLGTM
jgi:hypothetical protein